MTDDTNSTPDDEADDEPTCPECDGNLQEVDGDTYCEDCSLIPSSSTMQALSPWEYFAQERPTYRHSEKKRCVGGFPRTYDWVTSEEAETSVRDVQPSKFYK